MGWAPGLFSTPPWLGSAVPLVPLVQLGSLWLIQTVRLRYASHQVQRYPVCFVRQGHPCPACGDCSPPCKGRNRACPCSQDQVSTLQSYFIITNKGGGLQQILDLCFLNVALHNPHVRSLPGFHVSILPRHRLFLFYGLSLSSFIFPKVVKAALTPLREVDICILTTVTFWPRLRISYA